MTAVTKNRNMIFGPTDAGTSVVEFRTAEGAALRSQYQRPRRMRSGIFEKRTSYGLFVPTLPRDNQGERRATIRMRMRRGWADGGRA
jgi:hypothetical protein